MPRFTLDVGVCPSNEEPSNIKTLPAPWDNWRVWAKEYAKALTKAYPPPVGCTFKVRLNPHDFGDYPSVIALGDDEEPGFNPEAWEAWALQAENGLDVWPEGFGPPKLATPTLWTCSACGVSAVKAYEVAYDPSTGYIDFVYPAGKTPYNPPDIDEEPETIDGLTLCTGCIDVCENCGNNFPKDEEESFYLQEGMNVLSFCSADCLCTWEYEQTAEALPGMIRDDYLTSESSLEGHRIDKDDIEELFDSLYRRNGKPNWIPYLCSELHTEYHNDGPSIEDRRGVWDMFPAPPAFVVDMQSDDNPDLNRRVYTYTLSDLSTAEGADLCEERLNLWVSFFYAVKAFVKSKPEFFDAIETVPKLFVGSIRDEFAKALAADHTADLPFNEGADL